MGISAIVGSITEQLIGSIVPIKIGPLGKEILIDVLETESPTYQNEIAADPVECGTDVTDHILAKPVTVTIDLIFTDFSPLPSAIAQMAQVPSAPLMTWADKKAALYAMYDAAELVNLTTPLHYYPNMAIEDISPQVSAASGNCFRARVTLRAVKIAASLIGYIDPALIASEVAGAASGAAANPAAGPSDSGSSGSAGSSANSTGGSTADAYASWG